MIAHFAKSFKPQRLQRFLPKRDFSVRAIYSSFPATLHYYRPNPHSTLFDHKEADSRPHDLYAEGVTVDTNGLVYPATKPVLNGAELYPNTFFFQELVRRYFDETLDREDEGLHVETPYLLTIPKGTPIPSSLILINDYVASFSLQPSRGMSLKDLNEHLNEFYYQYATKEKAEDWLDQHPYPDAFAEDAEAKWMKQ